MKIGMYVPLILMYYDATIGDCVAASRCLYDNCDLFKICLVVFLLGLR